MEPNRTITHTLFSNPTFLKLGFISLFADIASEMLYPITPIFLTSVLGASMLSVGLIEGFAEGLSSLLKTFSGAWSDRLQKRKVFIWIGYLLGTTAKPIIGMATIWEHVLIARIFDRFGKGIRSSPRDALLADSISSRLRGVAFGWHRGLDSLGAALGAILALYLLSKVDNLRSLYFWALIPGSLSVLLACSLTEKAPPQKPVRDQNWRPPIFNSQFKIYLFSWGVFSLANSSDVFLILKVQNAGFSTTHTILLYAFYNLIYSIGSPFLGHLSDRMGRKVVLVGGLLVFASVYFAFAYANSEWHFWILFGVYGFYMAATDGVGKAFAVDLVEPTARATGLGLLGMITSLTTILASTIAGFLWDHLGSQFTFLYGGAGALLAAVVLLLFVREGTLPRTY